MNERTYRPMEPLAMTTETLLLEMPRLLLANG
jgi:hypothetical protein